MTSRALTVSVRVAVLDIGAVPASALARTLDVEERARADAIADDRTRRRFLVDHGLRRRLLAEVSGGAPSTIEVVTDALGKPALAGADAPRFNASRSGALAVYAVCAGADVGVDAEVGFDDHGKAPLSDAGMRRLADRLMAPSERAVWDAIEPDDRGDALYDCWTRKEAYVKALGTGLTFPLRAHEVWAGDARPVRYRGVEVRTIDLAPYAGASGAVAVRAPAGRPVVIDGPTALTPSG